MGSDPRPPDPALERRAGKFPFASPLFPLPLGAACDVIEEDPALGGEEGFHGPRGATLLPLGGGLPLRLLAAANPLNVGTAAGTAEVPGEEVAEPVDELRLGMKPAIGERTTPAVVTPALAAPTPTPCPISATTFSSRAVAGRFDRLATLTGAPKLKAGAVALSSLAAAAAAIGKGGWGMKKETLWSVLTRKERPISELCAEADTAAMDAGAELEETLDVSGVRLDDRWVPSRCLLSEALPLDRALSPPPPPPCAWWRGKGATLSFAACAVTANGGDMAGAGAWGG